MSVSHQFTFPLANGLHARPASYIVEAVSGFSSAVNFVNERSGKAANARSVLALVATETRMGDRCRFEANGSDEANTLSRVRVFLQGEFLRSDESTAEEANPRANEHLPRSLLAAGLGKYHRGQIASRGLGRGKVVFAKANSLPPELATERAQDASAEQAAFGRAAAALASEYENALRSAHSTEASILRAHLAILRDPTLSDAITDEIRGGRTAGQAVAAAIRRQSEILRGSESTYLRERVLDLEDIAGSLWKHLYGSRFTVPALELSAPSIVFAETLTPGQFLALDRSQLRGLVLGAGGQTSHTVILARSFGVPTLTGAAEAAADARAHEGEEAVVDTYLGIFIVPVCPKLRAYYEREEEKYARIARGFWAERGRPASTSDGRRIEVGANIALAEEAGPAFAQGAEGIGLFRTELLFANRTTAPSEDEQYALYAAVVNAASGRPVIIRTLDIGGDKPVPFMKFPAEANPFLGYRGVRFYREHAPLIKTQLRALLRAAEHGAVKILVPMIASVEEARFVRGLLEECRDELRKEGHACAQKVPLGFMLEVPSTAFVIDELCAEAEFFSLGTNDLAQYFFAADRENEKVSVVNDPLQPAFFRLLKFIVDRVHARNRWVGLCGELAENSQALPLLVGLGLDEISLAAPRIAETKAAIGRLAFGACAEYLERVLACETRENVGALLAKPPAPTVPLLTSALVLSEVDVATKEEAIRALVDALHCAGRTSDPAAVEEAVWQREETYSTGFGEGFALPHCKSDALSANSIAIARLRTGVDWNAMDGKPVDIVVLLGIRASEHGKAHMQTLARLSRLMMRDEFREELRRQTDATGVVTMLEQANQPLDAAKV